MAIATINSINSDGSGTVDHDEHHDNIRTMRLACYLIWHFLVWHVPYLEILFI
jgi:hypothetical protein